MAEDRSKQTLFSTAGYGEKVGQLSERVVDCLRVSDDNPSTNSLRSLDSSERPLTASVREEEEWETGLDALPPPPKPVLPTVTKELDTKEKEKKGVKQRGRGSFAYAGNGLYSQLEMDADEDSPGSSGRLGDDSIDGEGSNVLVFNCTSSIRTKDLEEIVEPFSREGSCTIRWIDDIKALAVFSSSTTAQEALFGINDGRVRVTTLADSKAMEASENEVAQRIRRPTSSAHVAQRMIAGALRGQGAGKQLLAQSQGRSEGIRKQERERKLRLEMRAQMRDEAWGSDDD